MWPCPVPAGTAAAQPTPRQRSPPRLPGPCPPASTGCAEGPGPPQPLPTTQEALACKGLKQPQSPRQKAAWPVPRQGAALDMK